MTSTCRPMYTMQGFRNSPVIGWLSSIYSYFIDFSSRRAVGRLHDHPQPGGSNRRLKWMNLFPFSVGRLAMNRDPISFHPRFNAIVFDQFWNDDNPCVVRSGSGGNKKSLLIVIIGILEYVGGVVVTSNLCIYPQSGFTKVTWMVAPSGIVIVGLTTPSISQVMFGKPWGMPMRPNSHLCLCK